VIGGREPGPGTEAASGRRGLPRDDATPRGGVDARDLSDERFIRRRLFSEDGSAARKYADLVVGDRSLFRLFVHELITSLLGPLPGALGLLLRKIVYPLLFPRIGRGVVFGRNVVLRHPHAIRIGERVFIDDYTLIDARGAGADGVVIEDDVIIGRGCYIQAKVGAIHIGRACDVGAGTIIVSQGGVEIGQRVSIGSGCKISGGMFSVLPDVEADPPYRRHSKGPVRIEDRCVLAMGAYVLDGVTVGEGTMVGAGSILSTNVPRNSVTSPRPTLVFKNPLVDARTSGDEPAV